MSDPIGYALIGAGQFGRYCMQAYQSLQQMQLIGVCDTRLAAAEKLAGEFGLRVFDDVDTLLSDEHVDIVHIATPPATHHRLTLKAIGAGKHVLCEKPLAMSSEHAQAIVDAAEANDRIVAANLLMRYDPLCIAVQQIIEEKLLGELIHGDFRNEAKDEPLPPTHWFWNYEHSGGIFIEHGVHFFDLFDMWFGEAQVVAAQASTRPNTPGSKTPAPNTPNTPGSSTSSSNTETSGQTHGLEAPIVEQVQCQTRYPGGQLVNFYHGFHQAERMDRQRMRLTFERGDIFLDEWIPTYLTVEALVDQACENRLMELLPHARLTDRTDYPADQRHVYSRHKEYDVDAWVRIASDTGKDKSQLYPHCLAALMEDQVKAILQPDHMRKTTHHNGYRSVLLAEHATQLAHKDLNP